jgi:hypothetical protein
MMRSENEADRAQQRRVARVRHSAAAVIAQFIQDLTRPPGPGPLQPA